MYYVTCLSFLFTYGIFHDVNIIIIICTNLHNLFQSILTHAIGDSAEGQTAHPLHSNPAKQISRARSFIPRSKLFTTALLNTMNKGSLN